MRSLFFLAALCVGLFSAQALKVEKAGTGMAVPMAGGEEDGRSTGGEDGSCAWEPDPKKGQEAKIQFRNMARISLKTYVGEVLDCLMANMRAKHLPSLKMRGFADSAGGGESGADDFAAGRGAAGDRGGGG